MIAEPVLCTKLRSELNDRMTAPTIAKARAVSPQRLFRALLNPRERAALILCCLMKFQQTQVGVSSISSKALC